MLDKQVVPHEVYELMLDKQVVPHEVRVDAR